MKRIGFLLAGLLCVTGCARVGLEVETVVHPDGSFERIVTYAADQVDRQTLTAEYQLPSGPGWKVSEETRMESPAFWGSRSRMYLYRAEGTFKALESDYAKKDFQLPPAFSRNKISIRKMPDGFLYEETFSDTANRAELRRLGERYVKELIPQAIGPLKGALFRREDPAAVEKIQRHVTTSALGYLDQIWHALERAESNERVELIRSLVEESGEFLISQMDQGWRAEGRHYPSTGGREQVAEALDEVFDKMGQDESWMDPYRTDLKRHGGAYLPSWMDRSYPFKFSVTMPAPITGSNATRVKGNTATWEFDPLFFLLRDYTLKARAKRKTEGS